MADQLSVEPSRQRVWLRVLLVTLAASGVMWVTVMVTIAGIARPVQAARLAAIYPFDARLSGDAAHALLQQADSGESLARALDLAKAAVKRDPTNIPGIRTLGLLQLVEKRPEAASRLFQYSERLSRRDLATQIWLIEEEVQSGDVAGALEHFDVALRTSKSAPRILLPVLASASEDPALTPQIRKLLLSEPHWRHQFFEELIHRSKSPAAILGMTQGLLDPAEEADRLLISAMISRLMREGRLQLAFDAFEGVTGQIGESGNRVRDGDFEGASQFPPFDWSLASDEDLSGLREVRDSANDDLALVMIAQEGRGGEVARQLLRLAPGSYRFSALVGNIPPDVEDRPVIRLTCIGAGESAILSMPFPEAEPQGRKFTRPLQVRQGDCDLQWLTIHRPSPRFSAGGEPWVDNISILPLR